MENVRHKRFLYVILKNIKRKVEHKIEMNKRKDDMIDISVIIPTFNVEAYIGQCLESLQKQTYRNSNLEDSKTKIVN